MASAGQVTLEDDLVSLSSVAAWELDDLSLDRSKGLPGVERLVSFIAASVPENDQDTSNLNPATAVVLNDALSQYSRRSTDDLRQLLREATGVLEKLQRIAKAPDDFKDDLEEIKRLRSFCLALSKSAMAARRSPIEQPISPFGR